MPLPPVRPSLRFALAGLLAAVLLQPGAASAQDAAERAAQALEAADALTGGPASTAGLDGPAAGHAVANYRDALRDIVATLSQYAKGRAPNFQVATREGLGLVIKSERDAAIERLTDPAAAEGKRAVAPVGFPVRRYARHLDGVVMNGQYCVARKAEMTASTAFIDMLQENGLVVLSVDHCATPKDAAEAWRAARAEGVLPHVDVMAGGGLIEDGLQRVPGGRPFGENADNVTRLSEARNLLLLDGSAGYADKEDLVLDLAATNYDVIALSPFHRHGEPLAARHVQQLRFKALGARRLVMARMTISQARDTAYYWKDAWRVGDPEWILAPVPEDPGLYDVAFWDPEWRAILGRTFSGLMDLGFDGIILEGTEAYAPLEARTPIE